MDGSSQKCITKKFTNPENHDILDAGKGNGIKHNVTKENPGAATPGFSPF